MKTATFKNLVQHIHMPSRHKTAVWMGHMVHDERFWPMVVAAILLAAFIAIAIWAQMYGETGQAISPTRMFPYYP